MGVVGTLFRAVSGAGAHGQECIYATTTARLDFCAVVYQFCRTGIRSAAVTTILQFLDQYFPVAMDYGVQRFSIVVFADVGAATG